MTELLQRAFTGAMVAAVILLVAYQAFMLWWAKRTVGTVPNAVKFLRALNITVLLLGGLLVALRLLRG